MLERAFVAFLVAFGLVLILSTCGADAECVDGCALPIWAVRP